jgi:hypothetical protein
VRIYRYPLEVLDKQILELPATAQPLSVAPGRGADRYSIDLWCLVPEIPPAVKYQVDIYGTGHPIGRGEITLDPVALGYVGTAVMSDGYVWHVFIGLAR